MEVRVLGPVELVAGGRDVTPARPKQRALLALLALRAGEVVSVDDILDALWGERPPPAARNAVQGHVTALRKLVGGERIETRGHGYVLHVHDGELDLDCFERLVTGARGRHAEERAAMLSEALALFRGDALEEFRYDAFAATDAARIDDLRLTALEERVDADLELGRHREVVPELERLTIEHPFRERLHEQLILALYRSGRQADALDAYRRLRTALVGGLGIQPGPSLQRLERQILNQDSELELTPAPPRVELPAPPNPLVGREVELAAARELLLRDEVRLVTLTGTGGAGKTRLALELADGVASRFDGGAFFVPLAPLADASLVLPTIARMLGVREVPGVPLERALAARLRDRRTLIVLDNFEHVLDAAVDVAALLAAAVSAKLLVTSREALRLMAEHRYHVPPLDDDAAAALFVARARAVRPDFAAGAATVREICRRLDRLPLAIELAAARTTVFSPQALLERLDARLELLSEGFRDQPDRHQTLKQMLAWSYELLPSAERRLFERLSVFAGGCTLDAAAAVCGDVDVVNGVSSLIDKSLVHVDAGDVEPRPLMLETIREYAAMRLEERGERDEVRRRHAEYFLELAESLEPQLPASRRELLDRLEREHANIRAALDGLEEAGDAQGALRLAGAVWRFWYLRGHLSEGRLRLERALAADANPTPARAKALTGAAAMAMNVDDVATARARSEESLALHRSLGDASGAAYAQFMLGNAVGAEGDRTTARDLYDASVRTLRECGDEHFALLAARHLAYTYEALGDRERARALHEDNLARARAAGSGRIAATALGALAAYAVEDGDAAAAAVMLRESLALHRELGDVLDSAVDLSLYARVLASQRAPETAVRIVAALEELGDAIGARRGGVAARIHETLAVARDALDANAFAAGWDEGSRLTLDEALALALAVPPEERERRRRGAAETT